MNNNYQAGIFAPVPSHARYLTFALPDVSVARTQLAERVLGLSEIADGENTVVGMGAPLGGTFSAPFHGCEVIFTCDEGYGDALRMDDN